MFQLSFHNIGQPGVSSYSARFCIHFCICCCCCCFPLLLFVVLFCARCEIFCSNTCFFRFFSLLFALSFDDDSYSLIHTMIINNPSLSLSLSFRDDSNSKVLIMTTEPRRLSSTDRRVIDGRRRLNLQFLQSSCDLWRTKSHSITPLAVTPSRLSIPSSP
jgi:hypothetical protein